LLTHATAPFRSIAAAKGAIPTSIFPATEPSDRFTIANWFSHTSGTAASPAVGPSLHRDGWRARLILSQALCQGLQCIPMPNHYARHRLP
jgi:hypothetical protein